MSVPIVCLKKKRKGELNMFKWNATFSSETTNYFTCLPLQLFAKRNQNAYLRPNMGRKELLNAIALFANQNPINEEIVNNWVDETMKEGRREVYIEEYDDNPFIKANLDSNNFVNGKLNKAILNVNNQHIAGNHYSEAFSLVKYQISSGQFGRVITLFFCKLIYCTEDNKKEKSVTKQLYPVVVDVYVEKGYAVTSIKTKSNMFQFNKDTQVITDLQTTTSEKQALIARNMALKLLEINPVSNSNINRLKTQLYYLVDSCTQTPDEIKELLDANQKNIYEIADAVVAEICNLSEEYKQDVLWDVQNMVEKYFSMTYPDKRIFTKNRVAYPLKLDATDQQESKVQQTSGFEEPLQSKDIFFDNKKMLQKNKKCDNVKFSYERLNSLYCPDRYTVQITVNRKCCVIKFSEYTVKEDIDNVLRSIIGN